MIGGNKFQPNEYVGTALAHIAFVFLGLFLAGCASPADVANMMVNQSSLISEADSPFENAVSVGQVDGGENTNRLGVSEVSNSAFRDALRGSLKQSHLLAPTSTNARFYIHTDLIKMIRQTSGMDFTVTSRVTYRVVERDTKETWFYMLITAPYTAVFSDSVIAVQRFRFASEGSIRQNIKEFISRLIAVKRPPG